MSEENELAACPFCLDSEHVVYSNSDTPRTVVCDNCGASALESVWNQRPDPWRYIEKGDPMPAEGQLVAFEYTDRQGNARRDFCEWSNLDGRWDTFSWNLVRWMPVPPVGRGQ